MKIKKDIVKILRGSFHLAHPPEYKIPRSNCDKCYIDEKNREIPTRMKGHKKNIRNYSGSSHIA